MRDLWVSFKHCSKSPASGKLARDRLLQSTVLFVKILWDWFAWRVDLGTLCNPGIAKERQVVARVWGHEKSRLADGQREREREVEPP